MLALVFYLIYGGEVKRHWNGFIVQPQTVLVPHFVHLGKFLWYDALWIEIALQPTWKFQRRQIKVCLFKANIIPHTAEINTWQWPAYSWRKIVLYGPDKV